MSRSGNNITGGLGGLTKSAELRQRIFFVVFALIVFRLGSFITLPGIDPSVMKFLFDLQDKYIKPLFEKGGKYERLYPLFEAGDTFTRTPPDVTKGSPHVRDSIDQKRLMVYVIYALTPCILFGPISGMNASYKLDSGFIPLLTGP